MTATLEASPTLPAQTCPDCGAQHHSLFRMCETCLLAIHEPFTARQIEAVKEEKRTLAVKLWERLCPPAYRSTDWKTHLELSPVCRKLAREWTPPPGVLENGLGIFGPTGRGKTRCMYAILARLHFSGWHCHAVEATRFAEAALIAADLRAPWADKREAREFLRRCQTVRVLFFDDLGKEHSLPGVAKAMHELFEHREAYHLTTLWTSERTGDEMAQFLGANYADGITRRLRDTCAIHSTEELPLGE